MNSTDLHLPTLYTEEDPENYPESGIFNFCTRIGPINPLEEAESYRQAVVFTLDDQETIEELNAFPIRCREVRKLMRRLEVKTSADIVPRMKELTSEAYFQTEYARYISDPEKWTTEHKGLDFEHYWEMMYRACLLANQGFVEY
jgi:hypothetical protein